MSYRFLRSKYIELFLRYDKWVNKYLFKILGAGTGSGITIGATNRDHPCVGAVFGGIVGSVSTTIALSLPLTAPIGVGVYSCYAIGKCVGNKYRLMR